jgi:hypothetical protein
LPAPDAPGGAAHRRHYEGGDKSRFANELQEVGFSVFGDHWGVRRRGEKERERGWLVFCEVGGEQRIATMRWQPEGLAGPIALGVVPLGVDRAIITNWLWRLSIEEQSGPNSLGFLVGGLSVLLGRSARFRSFGDLLKALSNEHRPLPAWLSTYSRESVMSIVLDGLARSHRSWSLRDELARHREEHTPGPGGEARRRKSGEAEAGGAIPGARSDAAEGGRQK